MAQYTYIVFGGLVALLGGVVGAGLLLRDLRKDRQLPLFKATHPTRGEREHHKEHRATV